MPGSWAPPGTLYKPPHGCSLVPSPSSLYLQGVQKVRVYPIPWPRPPRCPSTCGRSHKCPQHCDLGRLTQPAHRPHARSLTCSPHPTPDLSVSCLLHQHCFTWQRPSPCPSFSYTSQGSCRGQATFYVLRHLLLLQCLVPDTLPG